MREHKVSALFLLCVSFAPAQTVPSGWKLIKDSKSLCQIAVPPEWAPFSESGGSAILRDPSNAMAIVTSQPGQEFKPMAASMLKLLGVPKEKIFENSSTRLFYEDRTSTSADDQNAYTASAPGNAGSCSCRVLFVPSIPTEIARKIVLSLGPSPQGTANE